MTSHLLINESPLVVLPSLANTIGLNESIILQQLHYWLERSSNHHDTYKWVYNTYEDWAEQFPFWSISTIRRTFLKLEKLGLIISGNFNKMKLDKTKWYRINYQMLDELSTSRVQIEQNESMVIPCDQFDQTDHSTWPTEETKMNTPLPESTSESTSKILDDDKEALVEIRLTPYSFFEENGFGTIGGYISEKITAWCEDLSDELVIEAMKFAVERGSKTWAYVEAILRDWVDKQYTSVSDVHAARQRYKERRLTKQPAQTNAKKANTPIRDQVPSAEDLVRIGISLGKTVETIINEVQQNHPSLNEEQIIHLITTRIQLNQELEKKNKERSERFEKLLKQKRDEREKQRDGSCASNESPGTKGTVPLDQ